MDPNNPMPCVMCLKDTVPVCEETFLSCTGFTTQLVDNTVYQAQMRDPKHHHIRNMDTLLGKYFAGKSSKYFAGKYFAGKTPLGIKLEEKKDEDENVKMLILPVHMR